MWIYWVDQCKYCKNSNSCGYVEKVKELTDKLIKLEKETKGVYGEIKFNCDYFIVDEEEYWKHNIGETYD